jgi:MoxR-like ATPase
MSKLPPPELDDFIPKDLIVSNPDKKLHHIFTEEDCHALWAAYAAGRPLLVRGQPGTGKSQMARAIAEQLGWAFVSEVIRGGTELSDLHWHFDAIGRLGEAQAMANQDYEKVKAMLDPLRFLSPGAFWWAYDWQTAEKQYTACATRLRPKPVGDAQSGGVVLLLDEMDKAEPDLPNGLLETLGNYQFTVPYIHEQTITSKISNPVTADPARLLVIITTNEERELPSAFVRRCFVHTLKMEDSVELVEGTEKRQSWLIERGKLHFGAKIAAPVYQLAAELLWIDRATAFQQRYPPGLAEYIDLLTALQTLSHAQQQQRLHKIANYALQKAGDA